MRKTRSFLRRLGLPDRDLAALPSTPKRFPDGAQFRIEIPSVESPEQLRRVIEKAEELSVQRMSGNDEAILKRIDEFAASIPRRLVEEATAFGTVDQCIHKFEQYLDAGATSIIICNLAKNQDLVFRKYSKEIIPYLKRRYGRGK